MFSKLLFVRNFGQLLRIYKNIYCFSIGIYIINSIFIFFFILYLKKQSIFRNIFPYLSISEIIGIKKILYIIYGAFSIIFLYLAYFQLIHQPFYSRLINNYRFSVYFGIGGFSLYNIIIHLLNLNSSQFIADISAVFLIVLFISGYFFNSYYHKKTLNRIYNKFREKNIATNLNKSTSNDKITNDHKKNKSVYQSLERISMQSKIKKKFNPYNNFFFI